VSVFEDAADSAVDLWAAFADAQDADAALTYGVVANTNRGALHRHHDQRRDRHPQPRLCSGRQRQRPTDVRATDTSGAFVEATFTVTVTPVNDPPSFAKGADQAIKEDAAAQTVAGWATGISAGPANESGQSVTFAVTADSPALFSALPAVSASGTLTYTPAPDAFGTTTVHVRLDDNGGGTTASSPEQTFTIAINPVNDAPTFTKGADQSVNDTAGAISVPLWATGISAGPANESAQQLHFNYANDNPGLFTALPFIAPNGTLTFTRHPGTRAWRRFR